MLSFYMVVFTILCSFVLSVHPLHADMSWSMTESSTEGSETTITNQIIHISGERFAIINDQRMHFIIDLPADTMTMIDKNQKTYSTISLTELSQRMSSMQNDTNKMIEEALKQIPAEQRAQYESIIRQQMGSMEQPAIQESEPIDYSATGKSENIAGYISNQYVGTDENGAKHELWCSKNISTDEIMSFYNTVSSIDFFKDMQSTEETPKMGFPMKTNISGDGFMYRSEVTTISFNKVDAELFSIPKGFKKTEFGF